MLVLPNRSDTDLRGIGTPISDCIPDEILEELFQLEPMNANARKSRAGDLRATIPDGNLKVCNRRVQALFGIDIGGRLVKGCRIGAKIFKSCSIRKAP